MTIILSENQGYSLEQDEYANIEYSSFYVVHNKIHADLGIARIGEIEKDLSRITEIPYREEEYRKDGLDLEQNCVYVLRYADPQAPHIALLRVMNISAVSVKISCYKVPHE